MATSTKCPKCATPVTVPDELRGKRLRCLKCREPFTLDAPLADEPAGDRDGPKPRADDRPRRRRRDEDSDDRPRSRREESAGSSALVPVLVVCGVVVGVFALVGVGGYFIYRALAKPAVPAPDGRTTTTPPNQPAASGAMQDMNPATPGSTPVHVMSGGKFRVYHVMDRTLDDLLKLMTHTEQEVRRHALRRLEGFPIDEARRDDVCAALQKVATDEDIFNIRTRIYVRWAGPNQVPRLIEMLETGPDHEREQVVKALGRVADPRAVPVLVETMPKFVIGEEAAQSLIKIGDKHPREVEKPVLRELLKNNRDSRERCLNVLNHGTIAGADTVRTLKDAGLDADRDSEFARRIKALIRHAERK